MRIAIVTAWYPSEKNPLYGVFIQNQAKVLASHCDVTVLLLTWSLVPYIKERKEGNLTVLEKGDFYFPNASEMLLNFWASRYLRFFKSIHKKNPFDLIHAHDHYGAFVSDKVKRELGIPYVCTIHNSNIMNDTLVQWKRSYLPRVLSNASSVISVGKKLSETLTQTYGIADVRVIPNFIDNDLFYFKPTKEIRDFRFLFVGGLDENKGVLELVKAFHQAEINDSSLHVVGDGEQMDTIDKYIRENKLHSTVYLHGELANEKLPEIYNQAHVYVSVSTFETFGVSVLEAMSCGLPVLHTNSGGPNEIVRPFAGISVKHRTIEEIKDGLIEIYKRYEEFDSVKISEYAANEFGSKHVIDQLMDEYLKVVHAEV